MSARSVLPRVAVAAAAVAATLVPAPAQAIPPLLVTGAGTLSPGFSVPTPPQAFWFTGTATAVPSGTYACSFSGFGAPAGGAIAGTMSGWCGPYTYASCTFTLTLTSWDFVCTNGSVGTFSVSPANVNPTTRFNAVGTIS